MATFNDLVGVGKRNDILVKWRYCSYEKAMFAPRNTKRAAVALVAASGLVPRSALELL